MRSMIDHGLGRALPTGPDRGTRHEAYSTAVRLSQFWTLMDDEFGPRYAASLAHDLALDALRGRTADQALSDGVPPREVWLALCEAQDVPAERRHGKEPRGRKR